MEGQRHQCLGSLRYLGSDKDFYGEYLDDEKSNPDGSGTYFLASETLTVGFGFLPGGDPLIQAAGVYLGGPDAPIDPFIGQILNN
ncbi:MAG TPA: hypothetical protein VFQ44_14460 [Streptosporangiaceae bacterium]|nr:hypothetical protein [Streptosporangiaceae bacterium]